MEMEHFVEGLLDESREEVNRADSKANILLAAIGVSGAAIGGAFLTGNATLSGAPAVVQALAAGGAFTYVAAVALLGLAVYPRLGEATKGRAAYFMDHAQYDDVDELREALEIEAKDPLGRHAGQLLALARVVRTKYRFTRAGETAAAASLLLCMGAVLAHHWVTS